MERDRKLARIPHRVTETPRGSDQKRSESWCVCIDPRPSCKAVGVPVSLLAPSPARIRQSSARHTSWAAASTAARSGVCILGRCSSNPGNSVRLENKTGFNQNSAGLAGHIVVFPSVLMACDQVIIFLLPKCSPGFTSLLFGH